MTTQAAHFALRWVGSKPLSAMDIEFCGMEPLDHVIRTVRFEGVLPRRLHYRRETLIPIKKASPEGLA